MSPTTCATIALVLDVLGLAAAFGWQTIAHLRATGSTGFHGLSGRPGTISWWGGVLFAVALLLGLAAPVLALANIITPLNSLQHAALAIAGIATAAVGITITLVAQRQMGASWRIGVNATERTALVTNGLFAHLRNPIFTGMLTVLSGLAALVPTLVSLLALVCLLTAVEIQVRAIEEPYLIRAHGPTYTRYAATAGRFLPWVGRLAASTSANRTS